MFTKLTKTLKNFQLKYFNTIKIMFFLAPGAGTDPGGEPPGLENLSLIIMFISVIILIYVLINPNFWEIKLSSHVAYAMETDNKNLPTTSIKTLEEVNKTLTSIREEGIKLDVSPSVQTLINNTTAALTVSTGAYTGIKLAEMTPTLAGKAAVITGTIVATVATKTLVQEAGKNNMFTIETNKSCDDFKPIDRPQSPSNYDWSINNPHESSFLDLNTLLSTLESTDSLEKIMESLLTLSMVSFTLTLYVLITVILNLKDFTKVKWLNDNPKLLKYIERIKVARTSTVIPILLLLLFISLISCYGLYSVLKALLIYKSSIM
jgi:hypothetical protein